MKRIAVLMIMILAIIGCDNKKNGKFILNAEAKKKIETEIASINDKMSESEKDNMMAVAKMNYSSNPEVGIMYFEKLAKYRPEALRYLTEYYYSIKDYPNYEKWEKKAIEATGNVDSMYNLALHYDENRGNYIESEKYYLMAIKKGHKFSKDNLALLYGRMGRYDEATKLFHENGKTDGDGMYYTGMYYKTKKNYKKAEEIYNQMIAKGDPNGYFGMGVMYQAKNDKKRAKEMFQKGAELGEEKSANEIGDIYFDKKDYKQAEKYFLIAANKGNKVAIHNLGVTYMLLNKYEDAKIWFKKLSDMGDSEGKRLLKYVEDRIKEIKRQELRYVSFYSS